MKLNLLIAHYKEPWEQLDRLLSSISSQDINFNEISAIIINDGEEITFDKNSFNKFPFNIDYSIVSHRGTSKIRNLLLEKATAEYIWYLDPDDYLLEGSLKKIWPYLYDPNPIDLLIVGARWQETNKNSYHSFCPSFTNTFSIVGCNILRRQFLLDNNLYCDEKALLAGDLVIETLPKHYAKRRRRLQEDILFYSYEPVSVTHDKSNGWRDEANLVVGNAIKRLLKEKRYQAAIAEFTLYLFTYNSKYMYENIYPLLEEKNLYKIDYPVDFR